MARERKPEATQFRIDVCSDCLNHGRVHLKDEYVEFKDMKGLKALVKGAPRGFKGTLRREFAKRQAEGDFSRIPDDFAVEEARKQAEQEAEEAQQKAEQEALAAKEEAKRQERMALRNSTTNMLAMRLLQACTATWAAPEHALLVREFCDRELRIVVQITDDCDTELMRVNARSDSFNRNDD